MKKLAGYVLMVLGFLIFWPLQIGLSLYGLFYIVTVFLDAGVIIGLLVIPLIGVGLGLIHLAISAVSMPIAHLTAVLLQNKKGKVKWERELEEIWNNYDRQLATDDMNKRAEIEWRINHWRRFMEDGINPAEADKKAQALDYDLFG